MKKIIIISLLIITFLFSCKKNENNSQNNNFTVELHDFTGKKVSDFYTSKNYSLIIVNFWATFCGPCKQEMPDLSKIYTEYKNKGVLIIGASVDNADKKIEIEKLAKFLRITYPIFYGLPQKFGNEEIAGFPTTYFLGSDLSIKDKVIGHRNYDFFKSKIDSLLTQNTNDNQNILNIKKEFFSLTHTITKKSDNSYILILTLSPNLDYHLSGKGYPEISLNLTQPKNISIKPNVFTAQGIDAGKSKSWQTKITTQNSINKIILPLHIKTVACTDESCNMVNEAINLELNLQ